MQLDIHGTGRRLSRALESVRQNPKLPSGEKSKILEFDEFLAAKGYSEKRRLVYLLKLPRLRLLLAKNFRAACKRDLVRVMAEVEWRRSERTKNTYRVVVKKFYQRLYGKPDGEYPPQVAWIRSHPSNNQHILPEELLTVDEV